MSETPGMATTPSTARRSPIAFWGAALVIVVLDIVTKYLALSLIIEHSIMPLIGDWVRLTMLYNPGAAFGMYLGEYSRWIFTALAIVALVVLRSLYRATSPDDWLRALALGLIAGGAIANIINRLWSVRGVVDWIDIGIGTHRWPSFNVADIGVSIGAVLLAMILWREDKTQRSVERA